MRSCDGDDDGAAQKLCRAARKNNYDGANVSASGAGFLSQIEIATAGFFHHANVTVHIAAKR
jgi:hypothetical protein